MRRLLVSALLGTVLLGSDLVAQERPVRWERRDGPLEIPATVFHSTLAASLPTAETLRRGEWLIEVSHRFIPPVSEGADALWGLDGPVANRLGLSYAVSDGLMVGVLRSNASDNLELNAKVRLRQSGPRGLPVTVGVMGGVAWNTQLPDLPEYDGSEMQAYAQVILNALVGSRLAVGLVPTILHNPRVEDTDAGNALAVGVHGQLYVTPGMSLLAEWVLGEGRAGAEHDAGTVGLELETGGHFFKLVLTNSARLNPTQHLAGTPFPFKGDDLKLGFTITRVVSLGG